MPLHLFATLLFLICGCSTPISQEVVEVQGKVFGSYYKIKYLGQLPQTQFEQDLKTFFKDFNQEFSTYQGDSTISKFNQLPAHKKLSVSPRFIKMLNLAKSLYEETEHAFDPSLAPLINAWRSGGKNLKAARKLVGFELFKWDEKSQQVWKLKDGAALNVNAFAPGWAADLIGDYLKTQGVVNFLIDISGELLAKGTKSDKSRWMIGIERPSPTFTGETILNLPLVDQSISTSGNYRQYFINKKMKRSHIIDPRTGEPAKNDICSATVIAQSAATADAWSTALMVLGENGLDMAERKNTPAFLIRCEQNGTLRTITGKQMNSHFLEHSSR